MYADVAFPISSYQTFTYRIPDRMVSAVVVGSRVQAPLGKRQAQGIVVARSRVAGYKGRIRTLRSLVDDQPVLDRSLWRLIQWMSTYYLTPIGQVAKSALPGKLSTRYQPPTRWMVQIIKSPDRDDLERLQKTAPGQARILSRLQTVKELYPISGLGDLASSPLTICRKLAERDWVKIKQEIQLPSVTGFTFDPLPKEVRFNTSQKAVLADLTAGLTHGRFQPYLLHGVTGSGKTEIYIEAASRALAQDKTVIILLPEIAVTPQIAGRFRAVFGDSVALWHSKLSPSVRAWTWKQICAGEYRVVIGARSAIFAPLRNLGLIVVDEEQEHSYKQESPDPRYHARDVALMRGKIHKTVVVLATATPSLESTYNRIQGKFAHLSLPERYGQASYPHVHVVDMNQEQEESGKFGQVFSGLLQDKIAERLGQNEQVILLQNRRGYAPILRCGDCGEIEMCPACHVALTYHRSGPAVLQCHFCGHTQSKLSTICRHCASSNLKLSGTGTQKVEDVLKETFPEARVARVDVDTTRSGIELTRVLEQFAQGKLDILLGTQMIAKGLDFDHATLVGIINADMGLYLPDFRSGERIFQLIYQAAGRSGRRQKKGEVVIQTYNYENPVIQHAARLDIKTYYNIVLSERQELNYPPFSWMVKMVFKGPRKINVEDIAKRTRESLSHRYAGLDILGPAYCYRERLRNQYRMQLVFKSSKDKDPNGRKLHRFLVHNFLETQLKTGMQGVRIIIDVDPVSLL